ncbi:MAG: glycosyltransferase [bacterium]|nr:glycosyltransferase [bacterium]
MFHVIGRMFWSFEVAKKFNQLLTDTKPDLIHIHNIYHQLSPSLLSVAKRHGIPVVMTVHDYKLIWPDYLLCGYAPGASYWNVVRQRCTKGSYMKSALVVLEKMFHDWLSVYQKNIDLFLAPSEFVKEKLIVGGYDEKKIRVLPHFIEVIKSKVNSQKSTVKAPLSILYFGRLSKEKGVDILLDMMQNIGSGVELRIAGEGPELESLKSKVQSRKLAVRFLGRLDQEKLQHEIDRATFVVAPSIVPETFGYSILESFARGKTVIASRIGAFPELVADGKNGFLIPPGDVKSFGEKAMYLVAHPRERKDLEKHALVSAKQYTAERHAVALLGYYHDML